MAKIHKKISFRTIVIFLAILLACLSVSLVILSNQKQVEQLMMENLIVEHGTRIDETISRLFFRAQTLASFIQRYDGELYYFDALATLIVDDPVILNVLAAPNGIVSNVYPLEGNEAVLGLDFFSEGAGNREAVLAKETRSLVLGGPFVSVQGENIIVGRLPVFLDNLDGEDAFWGIVSVTLRFPEVLDNARLAEIQMLGFEYELWRVCPDNGERQIIDSSRADADYAPYYVEMQILFLNAEWYFRVLTTRAWYRVSELWILLAASFVFSLLVATVAHKYTLRQIEMAQAKEREAQELIQITKKLLDNSPIFMEYWDIDGTAINGNEKLMNALGISSRADYSERFFDFSMPIQPCGKRAEELNNEMIQLAIKHGSSQSEWAYKLPNGESLPTETTWAYIKQRDKSMVVVYSIDSRPIQEAMAREHKLKQQHEQHRIDIAEEGNRAKSRFLARMSHELRTPITAVMGISEIELQNPALPSQIEESFAKIYNSANSLLGIVNDILDLSKIEAGKLELIQDEYDVASMIVNISYIYLAFIGDKNIKFRMIVDENLPAQLIGDSLRITQIINNVLSNAFKYTMEGSVTLSISCLKNDYDDYITLVVSIEDSGLGMTPDQLSNLNDEYARFHEREYSFIEGTGLGMPIVYSLAKMMGASIEIDSKPNKGTNVTISIPQKITDREALGSDTAERLEQFEETVKHMKKPSFEPESMPYGKVLVVDDVEANLYVIKGLLAFYELNIETCESGYKALEKIRQGNVYDIVFMDEMMPGISGTEAMQQIRNMGYSHPIIALTANVMTGQAEAFIKEGFDGFISKPIQTTRLNSILIKHIKDKLPLGISDISKPDFNGFQRDPGLLAKLRADFAKRHSSTFFNICYSIKMGDIETAHRLTHTIKGLAGLLYEEALASAANVVEQTLAAKSSPTGVQLKALEVELNRVLACSGEIQTAPSDGVAYISTTEALSLLETLAPLLASQNIDCMEMLDDIRKIPQSELLYNQIEDFDFTIALETLGQLKKALGGE